MQMYVRGTLSRPDKVLVDIGTGYYAEMVSCSQKLYSKCVPFHFELIAFNG